MVMASVFWYSDGIFMVDYTQKVQTIPAEYYAHFLGSFGKTLPKHWKTQVILFYHDNAPVQMSLPWLPSMIMALIWFNIPPTLLI